MAKVESHEDGVAATKTSRYLEEMDRAAKKSLIGIGTDSEGRTLLAQSYYNKETYPYACNTLFAIADVSYLYMLCAGTIPLTWLAAYPMIACWGKSS